MTNFEEKFYNTTIFSLRDIAIELKRMNDLKEKESGGRQTAVCGPGEPCWDEERDCVKIPELGCFIDTADGSDKKSWAGTVKTVRGSGKRLPSSDDACVLLRRAQQINDLLTSHGRAAIGGWYWTSSCDGKDLAYAFFIGSGGEKCLGQSLITSENGALLLSD